MWQTAGREARNYYGGFRVAVQTGCYRKFSLDEAISKAAALGLKYLELSPAHGDFAALDTRQVRDIRRRILDAGISAHSYGVASPKKEDLEELFARAQEFGLKTLIFSPDSGPVTGLEKLAGRYEVNAAIHGKPAAVLEAIRGRSERVGAALDTGPDSVEAIEKLKGRIFSVHLKCPLAEEQNIAAILKELRAQGYDNILALECDEIAENSDAAIAPSLDSLRKMTGMVSSPAL